MLLTGVEFILLEEILCFSANIIIIEQRLAIINT